MDSKLVKLLGYAAFGAGVASIVGSAAVYLQGQGKREHEREHLHTDTRRSTGTFIGLWAPTFFAIASLLDRMADEDKSYMGIPIEHKLREEIRERGRELIRR